MRKNPAKEPRRISAGYLENAALYYLQRYATSSANLKRVLLRKIERSCAFHQVDPAPFYAFVDKMIERYESSGLLNDKIYADAKVATLRRQGKSRQAIAAKLQAKGLSRGEIETSLGSDEEDPDAQDLTSALIMAKKKKLGPYRATPAKDLKERQKDMAVLARAGFSYDIAKRALEYSPEYSDGSDD